MIVKGLLKDW